MRIVAVLIIVLMRPLLFMCNESNLSNANFNFNNYTNH